MLRIALFLVLLWFSACTKENRPRIWTVYTPADDRFQIEIPEGYELYQGKESTPFGEQFVSTVHWRTPQFSISKMDIKLLEISWTNIPQSAAAKHITGELLDSGLAFFCQSYGLPKYGRILKRDRMPANPFPGRSITACVDANKSDSLMVHYVEYIAGNRLYTITVNGYKQPFSEEAAMRFIHSFKPKNLP